PGRVPSPTSGRPEPSAAASSAVGAFVALRCRPGAVGNVRPPASPADDVAFHDHVTIRHERNSGFPGHGHVADDKAPHVEGPDVGSVLRPLDENGGDIVWMVAPSGMTTSGPVSAMSSTSASPLAGSTSRQRVPSGAHPSTHSSILDTDPSDPQWRATLFEQDVEPGSQ